MKEDDNKISYVNLTISCSNYYCSKEVFVHRQLNAKTVLFQAIQFTMGMLFSSIWPKDRTLLGATTLGQSGHGSNGNEGVLRIPQLCHNQDIC